MAYAAKMIADSISPAGNRLTTMEVTFPRFVLAEFNTHRVFSRNSASSRAIPIKRQIARIMHDPFIPTYWGANQKGMQADRQLSEDRAWDAETIWRTALRQALESAERMAELGAHKQLVNRLLEPFMWHTVIVTATEWSNFFALRAHADAQPEIREIATLMKQLYESSQPTLVPHGHWHLPFIQPDERDGEFEFSERACRISAARCARVSYLTHDGVRDQDADLALYERLVSGGHMSPLEHVASPDVDTETVDGESPWKSNFRGWMQFRKLIPNENDYSLVAKEE